MRTRSGGILPRLVDLLVHLRLHYQLVFLAPLFAWGFFLGGGEPSWRALAGFVSFHVFLYGGITAYNSYYDRDEGPVGGLRKPPPVRESLLGFSLVVKALGLPLALLVSPLFAGLYVSGIVMSVAYSHPTPRWKARPLLSLVVVALGQGAIGCLAGWLCGATPPRAVDSMELPLGLAVGALSTVGLYPLTQIYQIDEDRRRGDRTFAVAFGADASFRFALACVLLGGACLVPLVFRLFGAWDAALIALVYGALLGVIARWRRRYRAEVEANFVILHRLQLVMSVGMLGYIAVRLALR